MEVKAKPISISKRLVYESYLEVSRNKGTSGIDGQSLEDFDKNLGKNLYKIWNRLSSGSYTPMPVKEVKIPKRTGGERPLGIPTVTDRIAQTVIKKLIEPRLERIFHKDSYGYRPKRSAHEALKQCRSRCWQTNWVIDLDIKSYFDEINHELLIKALEKVIREKWIRVYITRWLKAGVVRSCGLAERTKGTPQGGVISPLLANLFLHYAFDKWMEKKYSSVNFERYADDIIIHTRNKEESEQLLGEIKERFAECKLEIHPAKSKIVYCKDSKRTGDYPNYSFDFLGFTFRARLAANKKGMYYVGFLPGISNTAATTIRREMRKWKVQDRVYASLEEVAEFINPRVRGWINYFQIFNKRDLHKIFQVLHFRLLKWIRSKYKTLKSKKQSVRWFKHQRNQQPNLFAHWTFMYPRLAMTRAV